MSRFRGWKTRPGLILRWGLRRRVSRYRLCRKDLCGRPDSVFPAPKGMILASGCLWNLHNCSRVKRVPRNVGSFGST